MSAQPSFAPTSAEAAYAGARALLRAQARHRNALRKLARAAQALAQLRRQLAPLPPGEPIRCPRCKGSGRVKSRRCPFCRGDKVVRTLPLPLPEPAS